MSRSLASIGVPAEHSGRLVEGVELSDVHGDIGRPSGALSDHSHWRSARLSVAPKMTIATVAKLKIAGQRRHLLIKRHRFAGEERFLDAAAMPVPGTLLRSLSNRPVDASAMEMLRDRVLFTFVQPRINHTFQAIAVVVICCVIVAGLLFMYAILGLLLRVDNGWTSSQPARTCTLVSLQLGGPHLVMPYRG